MPGFPSPSLIVAYASIHESSSNNDNDLHLLKSWCARAQIDTELLAEEMPPSEPDRPIWTEILQQIERGAVTELVVPSLFHVAGDDFIGLSKFLTFLKGRNVTLKSLAEIIDSRRDSKNDIVLQLVKNSRNAGAAQGGR